MRFDQRPVSQFNRAKPFGMMSFFSGVILAKTIERCSDQSTGIWSSGVNIVFDSWIAIKNNGHLSMTRHKYGEDYTNEETHVCGVNRPFSTIVFVPLTTANGITPRGADQYACSRP